MGVSIYYTARRDTPLTRDETAAVQAARARYPLAGLLAECGVPKSEFNGEAFGVYLADDSEPGVVFDGATKLPLWSEDAMWAAVQFWCRLLSDVRRAIPGATWHVSVEDRDIVWDEAAQAFDPSA